jgi:DNA primase small subunit
MASVSREYVCEKFSQFYDKSSSAIPAPALIGQREFALLLFRGKVMVRHKGVASVTELRSLLREAVPSDVYHSCAYYENPEADMDKKGWLGADLVFDVDADHIPTPCNKIHDEWSCNKCGFSGKGITPETCPVCDSAKFDAKTWPCDQCLSSAKEETRKVVDMLGNDFGFSSDEIHVFFSGHRGYHIHVESEAVKTLDAMARREIVDYVYGSGLLIFDEEEQAKPKKGSGKQMLILHDFGWNNRLRRGMGNFILQAAGDDLTNLGIDKQRQNAIFKNKEMLSKSWIEEGRCGVKGISGETWRKIARHVKDLESAKIDTVVTTDIHRLIRMNGTLHGKTGLKKIEFPIRDLEVFDPFREAVAFKEGTAKLFVSSAPEFRLGEQVFGPYERQTVELPTAAALLLVCKGRAEVVNG